MAFRGYIVKFGFIVLPHKYLAQNPIITPCQRTELHAYRDANGELHRVTIDNPKTKIEIVTLPLTLAEKTEIETAMNAGLINALERKFFVEYWNDDPTVNGGVGYRSGYFYLADVSYTYERITTNSIDYGAITYTFIEY